MNCPKCGAQLFEGAVFCGTCGYRLQVAASPVSGGPPAGSGHGIHIEENSQGQGRGYKYEVLHQPAFSQALIQLQPEQSIQAEAGAMVSMSANIESQSRSSGGFNINLGG